MKKAPSRSLAIALTTVSFVGGLVAQPPSTGGSPGVSATSLKKEKVQIQYQILESGASIDLRTVDSGPLVLDSLRSYGRALQESLRKGQFDLLFVFLPEDREFVNWASKNAGVGFSVIQIPSGIRLDITASTQASRTAVHEFIRRSRGGGPLTPEEKRKNHPGIDPGRDTQPVDSAK